MSDYIHPQGFGLMTRKQASDYCKDYLNTMLQAVADGNFDGASHLMSNGVLKACLDALSCHQNGLQMINGELYVDLISLGSIIQ